MIYFPQVTHSIFPSQTDWPSDHTAIQRTAQVAVIWTESPLNYHMIAHNIQYVLRQCLVFDSRLMNDSLFTWRPKWTRILLFFFLGVVSPYAVVEAGGQAQPGQVRNHQRRSSAADGVPGHHGGSNCPSEEHQVYQGLVLTEAGE